MVGTAPDVIPATSTMGPITGSNFGGHAPIVGAHIYVLQAGTGGYGTIATSLLTSGSAQYPITANTADPNVPAGWNYVTTDNSGNFNITGDYTCTPGLPVYVYGYGGTPAIAPSSFVTAYTVAGTTVTLTSNALLSNGQSVTFANFTGALAALNAGTYTVSNSTLTTFQITASGLSNGSGTLSNVTVSPQLINNPSIVNMAVLGNCPTSGAKNFSSLSFVFMNEVSTIATAYSLSGFFSNSNLSLASTDAVHLSIPAETGIGSPAWVGIENAASNAAILYDIQGSVVGTSGDGEAHIANSSYPANPNPAVVPQALINSMANVLATCVDSNSTSTTTSVACTSLFSKLGSTVGAGGVPTPGTSPTDTATAAIDMAHNPGNSNASAILGLATGVVPFTPTVTAANSTDLVIGITWPVPVAEQSGTLAQGLFNDYVGSAAIDSKGNVWVTSYQGALGSQGYLLKYDHLGNQSQAKTLTYNPEVLAIDNNNNVLVLPNGYLQPGTTYGVYEYTAASNYLAAPSYFNNLPLQNPESMVIDGSNNIYITAYAGNQAVKLGPTGTVLCQYTVNTNQMWGVGLDASSNVWLAAYGQPLQEWASGNCNVNGGNGRTGASSGSIASPQVVAFDSNGVGWVSDRTQGNLINPKTINKISSGTLTSYTGGGLNTQGATALAIDGSGNILAGTWGSNALTSPNLFTIFNGTTNQFLTTTNGLTGNYTVGGVTTTTTEGFWFFAIDSAGNLWSNGDKNLHEYIGVATPVLTPLAAAVKAGAIAKRP